MPYSAFIHRQKIEGLVNLDKSWMSTVANNPNSDILKSDEELIDGIREERNGGLYQET